MTRYIETENRVFRIRITPNTPGYCRRRVSVVQLSGPPLTQADSGRISAAIVASIMGAGGDVIRWSSGPKEAT